MKRKNANPGKTMEHPSIQEAIRQVLADDAVLNGLSFELDALESIDAQMLDFSRCRFRRVQFSDLHILRTHFTDCVFEQCDLSGLPFRDGTLTRTEFIDCRGTGTTLDRLKMKDILFRNCQLNYLTISDCQLERAEFDSCDLSHMILFGTKQQHLSIDKSRLSFAEINSTSLAGVDLSQCELEGITAQGASLSGSTINLAQAPAVLGLFGIHVEL